MGRHLNKMYVHWLNEIEDFRFDVTHLHGARIPLDLLSRMGFANGHAPAASTGDPDPESQQELFSRLGPRVATPNCLLSFAAGGAPLANQRQPLSPALMAQIRKRNKISHTRHGGADTPIVCSNVC
jgi:hypothetical protein